MPLFLGHCLLSQKHHSKHASASETLALRTKDWLEQAANLVGFFDGRPVSYCFTCLQPDVLCVQSITWKPLT